MQWLRRLLQRDGAINCEEMRSHRQYDRTFNLFQLVARFVHYVLRLFGRIKARRWLTFQLTKVNASQPRFKVFMASLGQGSKEPASESEPTSLRSLLPFLDAARFRNYIQLIASKSQAKWVDIAIYIFQIESRTNLWVIKFIPNWLKKFSFSLFLVWIMNYLSAYMDNLCQPYWT